VFELSIKELSFYFIGKFDHYIYSLIDCDKEFNNQPLTGEEKQNVAQ